ncbi:diacylglycerol kinase [Tabrizicola sp.]|uniref:diacylglycerol kinase n=1 Tax=Tabrizicola sp. TaxID=2005166 RepID=UPI003D2E2918
MKLDIRAELQRVANTVLWSWQGWTAAWASEKSLRQWSLVNVLSALACFMVEMTAGERALILALGLLILAAELMNTALEEVVDYLSTDRHPRAKKAKDCGSAAVALTAMAGGLAWVVVLIG